MISVRQLSKKYGSFTAVHDLTFDVKPGEVLGFLGPNGAGKTTTMRMVTGYLPPSGGRVEIGGFDIYDRPRDAKRRIGYLPENPPVYPEMTVSRFLDFVAEIKDVPAARRRAAVQAAIERARLEEVRNKRISKLSKGFRQRVGLAQAIVHDPAVLILDEPTSSLDPKQRVEVRELISGLRGSRTVILSTHILSEVSAIADRVFIINRGRVMAVDSPENLARSLRAGTVVCLEVQPPASGDAVRYSTAALEQLVTAIPGVTRASIAAVPAGGERSAAPTLTVHVESASEVDLRADVAQAAVGAGWRLLGLRRDSASLEEVFLKLTADEQQRGAVQ